MDRCYRRYSVVKIIFKMVAKTGLDSGREIPYSRPFTKRSKRRTGGRQASHMRMPNVAWANAKRRMGEWWNESKPEKIKETIHVDGSASGCGELSSFLRATERMTAGTEAGGALRTH